MKIRVPFRRILDPGWACVNATGRSPATLVAFLALLPAGALAFEAEPPAPSRCDDLTVVATRSFTSDCGWSATAHVQQQGLSIDVSLELHQAGDNCLPVLVDKTFRVPLGVLPPGEYTIIVSWTDLDQVPEQKNVVIADAECPEKLLRGDANRDHETDLADAIFLLFHLFAGGKAPSCTAAADADLNGRLDVADALLVLEFLFRSGPAPTPLSDAEAEACRMPDPFALSSAAFAEGEIIPTRHTCDGANVSPPLEWLEAPAGTRSFALTCLDPDAPSGTFVHWLAWDILAGDSSLAEGARPPVEGTTSANRVGYTGPCPPRGGGFHRYFFTLYALDLETLSLPSSTRRTALEAALEGHILATAVVMGRYQRN